jgi:hypothetical protein
LLKKGRMETTMAQGTLVVPLTVSPLNFQTLTL